MSKLIRSIANILCGVFCLAAVIGAGTALYLGGKNNGWFDKPDTDETQPDEGEENEAASGEMVVMPLSNKTMSLTATPLSSTPTAAVYTLVATVQASSLAVDWEIDFQNPASEWATGKTVTDYCTLTPLSDGSTQAELELIAAFGEPIIATARLRDYPDVEAVCLVDFKQSYSGGTFVLYPYGDIEDGAFFSINYDKNGEIKYIGDDAGETLDYITLTPNPSNGGMDYSVDNCVSPVYTLPTEDSVISYIEIAPNAGFNAALAALGYNAAPVYSVSFGKDATEVSGALGALGGSAWFSAISDSDSFYLDLLDLTENGISVTDVYYCDQNNGDYYYDAAKGLHGDAFSLNETTGVYTDEATGREYYPLDFNTLTDNGDGTFYYETDRGGVVLTPITGEAVDLGSAFYTVTFYVSEGGEALGSVDITFDGSELRESLIKIDLNYSHIIFS